MIGVINAPHQDAVVKEFFELFKTAWEPYRPGGRYMALICAGQDYPTDPAPLILMYGATSCAFDCRHGVRGVEARSGFVSTVAGMLPIKGTIATFDADNGWEGDDVCLGGIARKKRIGDQWVVRIGYDLFEETRRLLTDGQPVEDARVPSLDLHIQLVRRWMTGCGLPVVEIPPVPAGSRFVACLTHDVDHVGIRNHKFDHTMFGFIYRALVASPLDLLRGRKTLGQCVKNGLAVLRLPLVHLGLARDFWYQFDRYLELERGVCSTFFVVPWKGDPGCDASGAVHPIRACRYGVKEIAEHVQAIEAAGSEVGLHGIDAWRDAGKGRREGVEVGVMAGRDKLGVRMHWLYFSNNSPSLLEEAGFEYDSTMGYNATVGYRAGTTQAFKPLQTSRLMELPMHIMDTAMFYPSYLNYSPSQARQATGELMEHTTEHGGALVINWHDRSIAPERLWDDFYCWLLEALRARGAVFLTADRCVQWFRKRRRVELSCVRMPEGGWRVSAASPQSSADGLPGLMLRVHRPNNVNDPDRAKEPRFVDHPLAEPLEISLPA